MMIYGVRPYPGSDLSEHWFIKSEWRIEGLPLENLRVIAPRQAERSFPANVVPSPAIQKQIEHLTIHVSPGEVESLPSWVGGLERLRSISLPGWLLPEIGPNSLPETLEALIVMGGSVTISNQARLPRLTHLFSVAEPVEFDAASVPSVEAIHMRLPPDSRMWSELARLTRLKELALHTVDSPTLFARLINNQLEYLRLLGGDIASLAGIEALHTLTDLDLFELWALEGIEPLEGLLRLTKLEIDECPRIRSLEPLLRVGSLKRLWIGDDYPARVWGSAQGELEKRLEFFDV